MRKILLSLFLLLLPLSAAKLTVAGPIPIGDDIRVTDIGLGEHSAVRPDLAVLDDHLYATWIDGRDGNGRGAIYFARSLDRGETWSANQRVGEVGIDYWVNSPQIAVQPDGTLWIVWYLRQFNLDDKAYDTRIARSLDGGETWEVTTFIAGNGQYAHRYDRWKQEIAADSERLYILTYDYESVSNNPGYGIVLYAVDTATLQVQATLVNDLLLSGRYDQDEVYDRGPQLDLAVRETAQGTILCAAWEDKRERFAIFATCSKDQGETFASNVALSPSDAIRPQIALAPDGTLYAIYALDTDSKLNIFFRSSHDFGMTWRESKPITAIEGGLVRDPDIAVDKDGQVILPWIHRNQGYINNVNVSTSTNQGIDFATTTGIQDDLPDHYFYGQYGLKTVIGPTASGDETVYLIWYDDRSNASGLYELWFNRLLLDSTPPTPPNNVQIEPLDTAIRLTWDPSSDENGVIGYHVYQALSAEGPYHKLTPFAMPDIVYTAVGLEAGKTYFYQIAAVDSTGNLSARSTTVSGSPLAGSSQPSGLLIYEQSPDIHLYSLDSGSQQTIPNASGAVLSTDGKQLYYLGSGLVFVRTISIDGGLGEAEIFVTKQDIFDFDIAADNNHFAYLAARVQVIVGGGTCIATDPTFASTTQDIFTHKFRFATSVAVAPNRNWMAYRVEGSCTPTGYSVMIPSDFCLANPATQQHFCDKGADVSSADFAPDRNTLVYAEVLNAQSEIWRAEVSDTGNLENLNQLTRGESALPASKPRWSSNGEWILFQRDTDPSPTQEWKIFAVRNDGTSLRDLNIVGQNPLLLAGDTVLATPTQTPSAQVTPTPAHTPLAVEHSYLPMITR